MAGEKAVRIPLPDVIPCGCQEYILEVVEHFPDDGAADTGRAKRVWIEDNPENPRELYQKFWHEVIHCGEKEYGYQLKDEPYDSDVDRIAQCITQAFMALVEAA